MITPIPSSRRDFIRHSALLAGASFFPANLRAETSAKGLANHFPASIVSAPEVPLPQGKREPFGWKTAAVGQSPLVLEWRNLPAAAIPTALRLSVGLDIRDEKLIEARLTKSGRILGTFDIRFGCIFQVFSIPLAPGDAVDIRNEGISLYLTKGSELRVFTHGDSIPAPLQPHLLVPGSANPLTEYFARMDSLACIQAFSWQEGCVLDGLLDLAELPAHANLKETAKLHLSRFVIDGRLIYENHVSVISDGKINGIEGYLPFAALAKLDPEHALLASPLANLFSKKDPEGAIIDGHHTSSEGSYTVGYPLAILGKIRDDEPLQKLALTQLRVRYARLFDGSMFWRTSEPAEDGGVNKGNRAWSRGIAWQLLGTARTLRVLKHRDDIGDIILSFRQLAEWALQFQRPDGLWSVFADQPEIAPDTSGSAGIAAAFAIGAREGWLDPSMKQAAAKTLAGLMPHLTADGFLGGVSQANKGGEGLQRGNYRVIYQMGMGLMAQLIAALDS